MITQPGLWIAGALLLLAPSLTYAANNPSEPTQGSSLGDFDIDLHILPLAQIGFPSSLTNVDFGDFNESFGFQEQQQGFCVFHNTASVRLVAESSRSSASGQFMLAHSSAGGSVSPTDREGVEYQVEVFSAGTSVGGGTLNAGVPTPDFTAEKAKEMDIPSCSEGTANMQLRLNLASNVDFDQKSVGAYRDELTLTVTAE